MAWSLYIEILTLRIVTFYFISLITKPQHGAWIHHPEIKNWAESKSQMLDRMSHPGAPRKYNLFNIAVGLTFPLKLWVRNTEKKISICQKENSKNYSGKLLPFSWVIYIVIVYIRQIMYVSFERPLSRMSTDHLGWHIHCSFRFNN